MPDREEARGSGLQRRLGSELDAALELIGSAMYVLEEIQQSGRTHKALRALDEAVRQLRIEKSYERRGA